MAITKTISDNRTNIANYCEFEVDTVEDIAKLPVQPACGTTSKALVIKGLRVFTLTADDGWKELE